MKVLFLIMLCIYLTTSILGTKVWMKETDNFYNDRLFLNVYKTGYFTFLFLTVLLFFYDCFYPLKPEEFKESMMFVIVASILGSNVAIFFVKDFVRQEK